MISMRDQLRVRVWNVALTLTALCSLSSHCLHTLTHIPHHTHITQASVGEDAAMDTDASTSGSSDAASPPPKQSSTPEVELYCFMLLLIYLMDGKKAQQVSCVLCTHACVRVYV